MDLQIPTEKLAYFPTLIPITLKKLHIYVFSIILIIAISIAFIRILSPFDLQYFLGTNISSNPQKTCGYSNGEWVRDERYNITGSNYDETCQFLDPSFRCHQNGRVDQSFQHWLWQPRGCHLPR